MFKFHNVFVYMPLYTLIASCDLGHCAHTQGAVLQILHDQEILTTERTRKLLLKIVVEGFLSDCESVATWEKKLQGLMRDHEGDPSLNRILWDSLTAQARLLWQRVTSDCMRSFGIARVFHITAVTCLHTVVTRSRLP